LPVSYNSQITKFSYRSFSPAEAESLKHFYLRMRGQQGEFWQSSFRNDIPIKEEILAGDSVLKTSGSTTYTAHVNSSVHRAVAIHMLDGTVHRHLVASMSLVSTVIEDETHIVLQTPLSSEVDPEQVSRVSWLYLCRLGSDVFEQRWFTDETCDVVLSMQHLEYREAE
jgi:hypothetical protein